MPAAHALVANATGATVSAAAGNGRYRKERPDGRCGAGMAGTLLCPDPEPSTVLARSTASPSSATLRPYG